MSECFKDIDMWMKEPKNVAEIQVCNDARAIDTSKHKDYLDKYAVVGCYWPPSIVTLEADTLDPLKIVSTGSYTYDTNEYEEKLELLLLLHHTINQSGLLILKRQVKFGYMTTQMLKIQKLQWLKLRDSYMMVVGIYQKDIS
jgi:hypothetical protein